MNNELRKKFNLIMTYFNDYVVDTKKGLKEITLYTGIEVEPIGVIRLDVWIIRNEYLKNKNDKEVVFKSQTVFEFNIGIRLTEDELFDMFKYAEKQVLNYQPFIKDGDEVRLKNLFPAYLEIQRENMKSVVEDVPSYLASLR